MKKRIFYLFFSLGTIICTAQPLAAPAAAAAAASVVSWTCNAFYLPARSIWRRTVEIGFDVNDVRTVKIDGVPVYTFNIQGTTVLTSVDSERIQFDTADQTWTSDLRGMVSSQGRCER